MPIPLSDRPSRGREAVIFLPSNNMTHDMKFAPRFAALRKEGTDDPPNGLHLIFPSLPLFFPSPKQNIFAKVTADPVKISMKIGLK